MSHIKNALIPFPCEAAYNSLPGYRRPPKASGGVQGGVIMCIFIQNWYYFDSSSLGISDLGMIEACFSPTEDFVYHQAQAIKTA